MEEDHPQLIDETGTADPKKLHYGIRIVVEGGTVNTQPNASGVVVPNNEKLVKVEHKSEIDSRPPVESVKAAVSMFSAMVDRRAPKSQLTPRSRQTNEDLHKLQKEVEEYKGRSELAEQAKASAIRELDEMNRVIQTLTLDLEMAEAEESAAKEDAELAQLIAKEFNEGVTSDASATVVRIINEKIAVATAELKSLNEELRNLVQDHEALVIERDIMIRKAELTCIEAADARQQVDGLTAELRKSKAVLESACDELREAEEHRIGVTLARDQDVTTWEKEQQQVEEELQRLTEKMLSVKDLKLRLKESSETLSVLSAELVAYMEMQLSHENNAVAAAQEDDSSRKMETELDEVRQRVQKGKEEVRVLQLAAAAMKLELEKEKAALNHMQQMEGMAEVTVSSLEVELDQMLKELDAVKVKEKESRDKVATLPKLVQQAAADTEAAKAASHAAGEDRMKAMEEAERVKAHVDTIKTRLQAVLKESAATRESERLVLAAVGALEESEHADSESLNTITLPLDEYIALSKRAAEAEEAAHARLAAALSQVEAAKESELDSLTRLEETCKELAKVRPVLQAAEEEEERAKAGKLAMEQELRKWRAENEWRRKASDSARPEFIKSARSNAEQPNAASPTLGTLNNFASKDGSSNGNANSNILVHPLSDVASSSPQQYTNDTKPSKRQSFFPRVLTFASRQHTQARK